MSGVQVRAFVVGTLVCIIMCACSLMTTAYVHQPIKRHPLNQIKCVLVATQATEPPNPASNSSNSNSNHGHNTQARGMGCRNLNSRRVHKQVCDLLRVM